ncbi:hypothetical protein BYT27DRAFT_7200767 [Phlegmacium glaucopus]|nr:hypothetical protein BYT27DRAFT_7200767 [Phlegmacium glaucopus]
MRKIPRFGSPMSRLRETSKNIAIFPSQAKLRKLQDELAGANNGRQRWLSGARDKMNHSGKLSWLRVVTPETTSSIAFYEMTLIQPANADFEIE